MGASQAWFTAGAIVFMLAGGGHALLTLVDLVRPTFFAPVDDDVRVSMETTTFRFRVLFPRANRVAPSMYRLWLGMNISHGIGAFTFGLFVLLVAHHDPALIHGIAIFRPLTIAVAASYVVLCLRFWFYVPALACVSATACFTIATIVSA